MEKGNRNTVLLSVIGVATLLVALVGATFAYFTATLTTSGNTGVVNVTASQVSGITVTSGFSGATPPVYPGWVGYQYVDVYATGSASTSAKYNLVITVAGTGTGLTSMLGNVQYAACKKPAQSSAASDSAFASKVLATPAVNAAGTQYSMTGGNVALPSSCTAITADVSSPFTSGTKLTSTGAKSLASNQSITGTKHDQYYIIYRYLDNGDQSTEMGANFTVTPNITVLTQ